jgi:hypothetical protein
MIHPFSKLITSIVFLVGLTFSGLWAQKPDHLSISMNFKDSTVYIDAQYKTVSKEKVDSIYFLLNPGFELDTIKSKGLNSYKIVQKDGVPLPFWLLNYSDGIDENEEIVAEFKYKINLSGENHMKSNWIELNADKLWFPNFNALNNEFSYDVSITNFPETYTFISHPDAKITRDENQITIRKDTPWYEVLILAGRDMSVWNYDENITLTGSENIADSTLQSIGVKVKNSIDLLNESFGKSDPIRSFSVVLRNTNRKELGYQFNRKNMIVTGTDFNDYGNLSHEIAHFWWSRANFIDEPWINESFANYSMYLVLKEYDIEDYKKLMAKNREIAKNAIPVINASLFAEDSFNSYYHKGALHLISLEDKIGPELMRKLLSACVEKRIKTTETFLDELEELTNKEQRNFFEDLLKM